MGLVNLEMRSKAHTMINYLNRECKRKESCSKSIKLSLSHSYDFNVYHNLDVDLGWGACLSKQYSP